MSLYKYHCWCHRLACQAEVSVLWKLRALGRVVQRQCRCAVWPQRRVRHEHHLKHAGALPHPLGLRSAGGKS